MIRLFWRTLFGLPRTRPRHHCGSGSTLEPRQLLAATVGELPAISGVPVLELDGYFGVNGQENVLVFGNDPRNRIVTQIRLRGVTDPDVQPTISISGDGSTGFAITPPSPDFRHWALYVTDPAVFGTRTELHLRLEIQISEGQTITRDITVLSAETMSVTMNENPNHGRLVATLPAAFRSFRKQLQVIGNTAWTATYSHPVRLKSSGRIVVDHSYTGGYQNQPDPNWRTTGGTLFDYERSSFPDPPQAPLESGRILIRSFDPKQNATRYLTVVVSLKNVDERSSIQDQVVTVGADGTPGGIRYTDPDTRISSIQFPDEVPFNGPHELKIIGGDPQGVFAVISHDTPVKGRSFTLVAQHPELLNSASQTLTVQLLERGRVMGTAALFVTVIPQVT
jgi:hypothetical protein